MIFDHILKFQERFFSFWNFVYSSLYLNQGISSHKVIGYIVISVILPVPVWGVSTFLLEDPVK